MDVLEQVRGLIDRHRLLSDGQRVVVGVSGGADSLCLLVCLHRLGYECVVAHLDHGLRETSRAEADQVGQRAAGLGLAFERKRVELTVNGGSLEEVGRLERYRFLASVAHSYNIDSIAVGHTADDQAETVLMHLLRGAGPSGLRGMLPLTQLGDWVGVDQGSGLRLIRPLLNLRREDTQQYCTTYGLEPISDESNRDLSFFRNRLRHELLPELERYNPEIRQVLTRTARLMAGEAALVDELVEQRWSDWVRPAGERALAFRRERLEREPVALQRAALRRAVSELRPELRDIGFDPIEQVVQDLAQPNGARRTIVGGLEVIPLDEELVICEPGASISFPALPQLMDREPRRLPIPGELRLAHGWRLTARTESEAAGPPTTRWEALMDGSDLSQQLHVRRPTAGDRLRPLGMSGTVKLSDLFVNRKVPWPARERWPVVCDEEQVLWVVGLHVSRDAAASETSQNIVRLTAAPPGEA